MPGSGTYGIGGRRQFATGEHVLVAQRLVQLSLDQIRGWDIPASHTVMKARRAEPASQEPFAPAPIDDIVATIREEKPAVVFAPHVETSAGMILPDDYISALADAVHEVGGLLVLDCVRREDLGRHGGHWCRCVDLGAAEGLERVAVRRARHAQRAGPRPLMERTLIVRL